MLVESRPPTPGAIAGPAVSADGSYKLTWRASAGAVRHELETHDGDGAWSNVQDDAAGTSTQLRSGPARFEHLHRDHLDSVEVVSGANGGVVHRLAYDRYGARRAADWSCSLTDARVRGGDSVHGMEPFSVEATMTPLDNTPHVPHRDPPYSPTGEPREACRRHRGRDTGRLARISVHRFGHPDLAVRAPS